MPSPRPPSFPPLTPRRRPETDRSSTEVDEAPAPGAQREPARSVPTQVRSAVTNRLAERLAELRAAKQRARLTKVAVISGAIVLAAVLAWAVAASPLLALKLDDVEVSGAGAAFSEADVRERLTEYEGTPLALLDLGEIQRALVAVTAVKDAVAARQWPSGLRLEIRARTPVAAIPADEGYTILDGDGVELAARADPPEGLPVVDVPAGTEDMAATIEALLHVLDNLSPEILEEVSTVGARGPDEVTFTLESGGKVVWGGAQDSALKASVLEVLLEVPAQVYNVTSPLSPITS